MNGNRCMGLIKSETATTDAVRERTDMHVVEPI